MNTLLNAVNVLKAQGIDLSDEICALAHVTALTHLTGRWMEVNRLPKAICDTGHNVGGWQYLVPQIKAQPCKQLRIVFGMVDDKDIDTVMGMLPKQAIYYWTQATTKRAVPADKVSDKALLYGLSGHIYKSVKEAYSHALAEADDADFIFIGGSSYIVANLLSSVEK